MKQLRHFYSDLLGGKPSLAEICRAREDTIIREELIKVRPEKLERRASRVKEKINETQLILPFKMAERR